MADQEAQGGQIVASGGAQPEQSVNPVKKFGDGFVNFFKETANSTQESFHGLKQRITYAGKQLNSDFKHDEETALNIAVLRNVKEQYRRMNKSTDSILQHEKDFSADEQKYGTRMLKASAIMDTPKHIELLEVYGEAQVCMSKARGEFVNAAAKDLQTPVKQFIHTNIKQAQQKKHECNRASMWREETTKNYQKRVDAEAKKDEEKRDEAAIKLAEQKMNEANNRYTLLSQELEMLVLSLNLKKTHELPDQLMAVVTAQEEMLENCLKTLRETKEKMQVLINDIQSGNTGGTISPEKIAEVKFKSTGPQLEFQRDGTFLDNKPAGNKNITTMAVKKNKREYAAQIEGTTGPTILSLPPPEAPVAPVYNFSTEEMPPLPPKPKKQPEHTEDTVEVDLN